MEAPECPVCLQSYDAVSAVPRVLACGHTACEPCLAALPSRPSLPAAVRCPACTQTVPLPRPLSALPKNIDLLRLSSSSPSPSPTPKPKLKSPPCDFVPLPSSLPPLLAAWKDWILPEDSFTLLSSPPLAATVRSSLGRPWCLNQGQRVSLVLIADGDASSDRPLRWSYLARTMNSLRRLNERVVGELGCLLDASLKLPREFCRVYGLWVGPGDEENPPLFLVSEWLDRDLSGFMDERRKMEGGDGEMAGFGMVCMELCEALMALHSEGILCGCLAASSFRLDGFGHCLLDLGDIVITARRIWKEACVASSHRSVEGSHVNANPMFVSPEMFLSMLGGCSFDESLGYASDVWSLACILVLLLTDDPSLMVELYGSLCGLGNCEQSVSSCYEVWRDKVVSTLEALHLGMQFDALLRVLALCLDYDPHGRPQVTDLWRCMRDLSFKSRGEGDVLGGKEMTVCCLILSDLCSVPKESCNISLRQGSNGVSADVLDPGLIERNGQREKVSGDFRQGILKGGFTFGGLTSTTLQGHHDCISGLAVGGGFLFSSSFDKSINVWSLQDFSHVQTLRGPEHRITAIYVADKNQPLCVSGDSGSGIFIWSIGNSLDQGPLKKWYEHNDWRYSGVHSLAISGEEYLYTGSGDKSVKAWSLQDYSLSFTMTGHKSTVSSLAVTDGILYSGSWDGTIRLWWLHDHSPLAVLGEDAPEMLSPILSLSVDRRLLVASYENGKLKMWKDDKFVRSIQVQQGAIFALHMDANWLFSGGWDQTINIQELLEDELQVDMTPVASISCDSVITSLLYWDGKLFVGLSNKEIKVYYYGP